MYAVSAAFLAKVRQGHTIATRLDVCLMDGTVLATIRASDGDVTVSATRAVRRECQFTIPDPDGTLTPDAPLDTLSSLSGNELRPYRGVILDDSTTEFAPLGVFPIRDAVAGMDTDGTTIALGGQDRSTTISRNRWTGPYVIAAGTALETAITALIADRAPGFTTNLPTTGITVPATTFGMDTNNDPWADAQSLATAAGFDLFFDVTGVVQMQAPLDPTTAVATIIYADDAAAVVTKATKRWDSAKGFNGCIAIGEGSSTTPVNAVVWDDDPTSPTYYLGPYGAYPETLSSPLITTASQAFDAATAQVARRRGVAQDLSWEQVVNPAHDANDAVGFTSTRLHVPTLTVVLDQITIPWLSTNPMTTTTRTRQVSA